MDASARENLNDRIRAFFIEEIRKACGNDFVLIEEHIDKLITFDSLKDSKNVALGAVLHAKYHMDQTKRGLVPEVSPAEKQM